MGELERDVSCTKERNPRGQLVEFEESCARDKVLLSGNAEVSRFGSGGDHEAPRLEHLAIYRHPLRTPAPRGPLIRRDPSFLDRVLPISRPGEREGPFGLHRPRPRHTRSASLTPPPPPKRAAPP